MGTFGHGEKAPLQMKPVASNAGMEDGLPHSGAKHGAHEKNCLREKTVPIRLQPESRQKRALWLCGFQTCFPVLAVISYMDNVKGLFRYVEFGKIFALDLQL